jgi:hypothetical protein
MSSISGSRGAAAALAGAILLGGLCQAGCTGVSPARKPAHRGGTAASGTAVRVLVPPGNGPRGTAPGVMMAAGTTDGKALIRSFIARLQPGAPTSFEAEYLPAGRTARKIVYAVGRSGELLFQDTALLSGRGRQLVLTASGDYLCRSPGHARWACQQLDQASAAAQRKAFAVYTAPHWAAYLKTVAFAAGARAATFRSANMPRIGKAAPDDGTNCIDVRPAGAVGFNVICAAAPGVLGSVVLCTGRTSFLLESYEPAPPASLFRLPPGATVTRLTAGQH